MQFDEYAASYKDLAEKSSGVSVEKLAAEKARMIEGILNRLIGDPSQLRVLDVGCGIGLIDRNLEGSVKALFGIDMSSLSIQFAKEHAKSTTFVEYGGGTLPFETGSFDCSFASCVLHHVPPAERVAFMKEMMRVTRPGGAAIIIEHNPINPVTRRIVSLCAFDADAVLLYLREAEGLLADAGASRIGRRYTGFSPVRNGAVETIEGFLGWLPIGAQYCVWGVKA